MWEWKFKNEKILYKILLIQKKTILDDDKFFLLCAWKDNLINVEFKDCQ
jgi:hypothetical protein